MQRTCVLSSGRPNLNAASRRGVFAERLHRVLDALDRPGANPDDAGNLENALPLTQLALYAPLDSAFDLWPAELLALLPRPLEPGIDTLADHAAFKLGEGAGDGLGAPKNTPVEIIGKLNTEINAALADPGLKLRFADLGGSVVGGSADDFAKLVSDETDKWGGVVRAAHIKAE